MTAGRGLTRRELLGATAGASLALAGASGGREFFYGYIALYRAIFGA